MLGTFIFDRSSFVMKKWQILEFDGKPYYAFVPENDDPLSAETIPSNEKTEDLETRNESSTEETIDDDDSNVNREIGENCDTDDNAEFTPNSDDENDDNYDDDDGDDDDEEREKKPILSNPTNSNETSVGDLYQVKVEGTMVTLEKLAENVNRGNEIRRLSKLIKQEPINDTTESEPNEEFEEMIGDDDAVGNVATDDERDTPEVMTKPASTTFPRPRNSRRAELSSSALITTSGGALRCKACSESFGSAMAFRKHVAWTHKKKVCIQENGAYICAVCDFRTLKKSIFAEHLTRKHETWTRKREMRILFPCEACGFVCRSKHSLQSHFTRKHTDNYEHNCQFCGKRFKVKGDLTNHVRFHHKEKPINCDVCGKLCQNTGSLYVHQKWAHYKPKYECHICKRRMVTQENLDQHLLTQHEQREKIVCAQCGKTFTKKDSFKRHMAVHTGNKPHSCPICTKPFARQSQLRQHVLIHTGQRPFVCDICGKGFTQKPGLICHRKTHPGPLPPLPVMPIADLVRNFIAQTEESQSQDLELE